MKKQPSVLSKTLRVVASLLIAGYSFISLTIPQTAKAATAPSEPTNVSTPVSGDTITINWFAPLSDGGSPVTGWQARIRLSGDTLWSSMWVQPNVNQVSFSGLTAGTEYDIAVAAINDIGTSPDSEVLNILVGDVPYEVENLTFTNSLPSIGATWEAPTYAGSTPITSYDFEYSPAGQNNWDSYSVPTGIALVNGVSAGLYDIRVRAVNSVGAGDWSYLYYQYLGTVNYDISSCNDLFNMYYDIGGTFNLVDDIDCSGLAMLPIGRPDRPFSGVLNGNGHTISAIHVQDPITPLQYAGLFGVIDGAHINDLAISGDVIGNGYAGGLAAYAQGSSVIENVTSTVDVTGGDNTGGLIGYVDGPQDESFQIQLSSSEGTVQGNEAVGGLVGYASYASLDYNHATGEVTSAANYAGGLIGRSYQSTISRSYATGDVTSGETRSGGLVGESASDTITDSYARGDATAPNLYYTGGFIGAMNTSNLLRVYSSGVVNGYGIIGGLIGYNVGASTITDSFSASYVLPESNGWDARANNGLVGIDYGNEITYNNVFFNSVNSNPNCTRDNSFNIIVSSDCTGINSQFDPEIFMRATDQPIANWNLNTVWQINDNDYPTLSPSQEPYILCEQTSVTNTTIRVACDSTPNGWGSTTWEMQYKKVSDGAWAPVTLNNPNLAAATLTDLTPGTDYQVRFRFTNTWGTSEWGRIDATTTGTAPTNETASAPKPTALPISSLVLSDQITELAAVTDSTITLDDFSDYTDGSGHQLTLEVGQVIYFYVNGERHSATVTEIGPDYVILRVASEPQDVRISLGKAQEVSVNQNGTNDVRISLISIQDGRATLSFAAIPLVKDVAPVTQPASTRVLLWLLLIPVVYIFAVRRRRHA